MAERNRAGHVAIVGRPNVGKSTLLNRLIGQRLSITSRKPQTTRHRVLGIVNTAHAQYAFVDTPGFQSARTNALGAAMNRTVTRTLADVDAIVLVVVAGRFLPEDERVAALLPKQVPAALVHVSVPLTARCVHSWTMRPCAWRHPCLLSSHAISHAGQ